MNALTSFSEQLTELSVWRQDIHRHPELAFNEFRTADLVADRLRSFGLDVHTGIGRTGIVAVIDGDEPGPTIGFRADMDALPMRDESGRPYASSVEGQAHSCGHDGHTVALLGFARHLAANRPASGSVVLIFQPAEEAAAGAAAMIEDGILERLPLDEIYAFHNMPSLRSGTAAVIPGTTLNGACLWEIDIEGVGGHGAAFYETTDPLQAAARLTVEISSLVGRYIDPTDTVFITVGKLQAGTAANVIPGKAVVSGTLRGRTMEGMARIKARLDQVCEGIAVSTGCTVETRVVMNVPPCINRPEQAAVAARACAKVLGEHMVFQQMPALPFTDDFAHFLDRVPGAYLFLGQDSVMCHHPAYDFDDNLLAVAGSIFAEIVADRLGRSA
jgi:hippurate hydrolase